MSWEPVIGLEIHVHLKTRTKMFCRCALGYADAEHAHVPGLPRASRDAAGPEQRAIEWTIQLGTRWAAKSSNTPSSIASTTSIPTCRRATRSPEYDEPLCVDGAVAANGGHVRKQTGFPGIAEDERVIIRCRFRRIWAVKQRLPNKSSASATAM